jgi:type I restriction enzyme R subunit
VVDINHGNVTVTNELFTDAEIADMFAHKWAYFENQRATRQAELVAEKASRAPVPANLFEQVKAWWEPLMKRAPILCDGIGALVRFTIGDDDLVADFPKGEVRRYNDEACRYWFNIPADLVATNSKYVMQITGDNKEGKDHLDAFISPNELYPVIATTSKLMTTGVDAQTCKLIVLDSNIGSMTEFKQIIGRGTRINEDFGKHYFTIMDFRNVTALFADKDFDGDPVRVKQVYENNDISQTDREVDNLPVTDELTGEEIDFPDPETSASSILREDPVPYRGARKVTVNGVEVAIIKERVQYMDDDGKIITESLRDYTRRNILKNHASLDDFLTHWSHADRKQAIVEELEARGVLFAALQEEVGSAFDPFDLVCHIAYDKPPLTRKERADAVRKRDVFGRHEGLARKVLESLLEKYADEGALDLENPEVIRLDPLNKLGSPVEIIRAFGGRPEYEKAVHDLAQELYQAA